MYYTPGTDLNDPFGIRGRNFRIDIITVYPNYAKKKEGRTWVPGQEAVPGRPGQMGTPDQLIKEFHEGWNSHARSKEKLDQNFYFIGTVSTGVRGCLIGIEKIDQDNRTSYPHALISDISGIHVYENNTKVHTFTDIQSNDSKLRVYNQGTGIDRKIIYVCTTKKETDVYTSTIKPAIGEDLYVYGLLYAGLDQITTYEYKEGVVKFGAA